VGVWEEVLGATEELVVPHKIDQRFFLASADSIKARVLAEHCHAEGSQGAEGDEEGEGDEDAEGDEEDEEEVYVGSLCPLTGERSGRGTLRWGESSARFEGRFEGGERCGRGTLFLPDGGQLSGMWREDVLEGPGVMVAADGSTVSGRFTEGELGGPVIETGPDGKVVWEGTYLDNMRHGTGCLVLPFEGGTLEGVWVEGLASGSEFVYTYDSCGPKVLLRGDFVDSEMRSAIVSVDGAELIDGKTLHHHDPSTATRISIEPLLPDPYEAVTVYVDTSPLCAGGGTVDSSGVGAAGEGLFAKRALCKGETAAFYNGVRLTHPTVDARGWSDNANTMSLAPYDDDTVIDVPPPFDTVARYCASLGHKANHAPVHNAKYAPAWHPRFGCIKRVVAIRDIEAGEEVTVDYGYTDERPDWFTRETWGPTTLTYMASHKQ
jgi:histone-lysine N-methyltransferase SETD7